MKKGNVSKAWRIFNFKPSQYLESWLHFVVEQKRSKHPKAITTTTHLKKLWPGKLRDVFFWGGMFFFVSKKTDDWNLFFVGVSLVIFWQGSSPNSSWVGSFLSGGDAWHAVEWDFWTRKKSDSKYLTLFWKPWFSASILNFEAVFFFWGSYPLSHPSLK